MKKGRRGAVLRDCLRKNRVAILLWVLTVLTEWVVFYLYRIMWEPLLYAGALTLALGLLLLGLDLRREMQAARERLRLREAILTEWNDLPANSVADQHRRLFLMCGRPTAFYAAIARQHGTKVARVFCVEAVSLAPTRIRFIYRAGST